MKVIAEAAYISTVWCRELLVFPVYQAAFSKPPQVDVRPQLFSCSWIAASCNALYLDCTHVLQRKFQFQFQFNAGLKVGRYGAVWHTADGLSQSLSHDHTVYERRKKRALETYRFVFSLRFKLSTKLHKLSECCPLPLAPPPRIRPTCFSKVIV